MCSDADADAHRFMDLLDAAIEGGEAKRYPKYTAWAKKVAARPRPKPGSGGKRKKAAAGRGGAGAGAGSEAALIAAIRGRQPAVPLGGVLGQLMASMPDEPSEEEFQAAAARLKQRASGGGSSSGGGGKQKAAAGGGKRAKK